MGEHELEAGDLAGTGRAGTVLGARWRSDAIVRAQQLREAVMIAETYQDQTGQASALFKAWVQTAHEEIDRAIQAAEPAKRLTRRRRQWLSGSAFATTCRSLHAAEAALVMIEPSTSLQGRLHEIEASVATILGPDDGRTARYLNDLKDMADKGSAGEHRDELRAITNAINDTADTAQSNLRSYRNWVFGIGVIVTVVLAGVALAHAIDDGFIAIPVKSINADVSQLEAAGAVGGLLMALFSLIRLQVYSGPFNLPFWQAVVRIPAGAAAALVGAAFLQGRLLTAFHPATQTSTLFAYAVLFGAAPEIVLQFVDKQINKASAAARSKNDPLRQVSTQA